MKKKFLRDAGTAACFLCSTFAFSMGAETDVPFALQGAITFQGPSPNPLSAQNNMTCKVVMSGRTNAKNQPATITAAKFSGDSWCTGSTGGAITLPWSMSWAKWNAGEPPAALTISNVWFSTIVGDCFGELKGKRIYPGAAGHPSNEIYFESQAVGNCRMEGYLRIISNRPFDD
jgi:hypothetical protein